MNTKAVFEVCAFNIQSAIIAEKAGAVRAELCDNPVEGGTTPSFGAIKQTRQKINIQLYPIIRPRSGNYFYDADEFEMIGQDIKMCKELGCDGISIGIQRLDGTIDLQRMSQVVEWAYPMGVTCNRVFDTTPDPMQALEDIIAAGCERILTSGQKSAAPLATAFLATLVQAADERIIIMPGAGVNSGNIEKLIQETGAREFHGSARKIIANPVLSVNPDVLDYGNVYVSDEEEVRKIVSLML
ncbi:MAG: copper homeostasis protein CutC [Ferruginibacter sp.]|nr:copper homeostasis protein CutC [Ferruginibacter sp.]